MKNVLEQTLQVRKGFDAILKNTSHEDLLKIPEGFNNNIWWNIAHVVVTQQGLLYGLSGLELKISLVLKDKFKKGTKPDGTATEEEIEEVEKLLFSTIETTIEDYENGLFSSYSPYATSAKVTLNSIEDAIPFNFFHEGLHYGTILALRRAIKR